MFWVRNEENSFPIHTLIWRPEYDTDTFAHKVLYIYCKTLKFGSHFVFAVRVNISKLKNANNVPEGRSYKQKFHFPNRISSMIKQNATSMSQVHYRSQKKE